MTTIITAVKKTIQRYNLLNRGDSVLAGVSGGPDSVVLLHVLQQLRREGELRLFAVHVNHQLRRGADQDERFVESLCSRWQIPCTCIKIRIKREIGKSSLEELAREKRLTAMIAVAKQCRADTIALGHQRDDLAETVLMRILRGTGLLGLQSILPLREIKGKKIIRPLIETSREQILAYARKNKLPFRTDPTNATDRFLRNKIRRQLLPLLEKNFNPNIREVLADLSAVSGADYALLHQKSQAHYQRLASRDRGRTIRMRSAALRKLHPSLRHLVLRAGLQDLKGDTRGLAWKHVQEIEDLLANRPQKSCVHLPNGLCAVKEKDFLRLSSRKAC